MIDTQKGKETLLKLKDCVGVENMLFFVDAEYESDKDLVSNKVRDFLEHKMTVVYQSENKLSTAISDHMEHKCIDAFHLLNQYLLQATEKTTHSYGCIFGREDAKKQLAMTIEAFFMTPLTFLDLFLTTEPASAERAIKSATVRITRNVLIREIVNTYKLKGIRVTDYLEEEQFNDKCMMLLEKSNIVKKDLPKSSLITELQEIAENHKEETSVAKLRSAHELVERLSNHNQNEKGEKRGLHKQFKTFLEAIAMEAANALLGYFLDMGSNINVVRNNLDILARVRKELLNIMEKTIDGNKYDEVMPKLPNWRSLFGRTKEVKAVLHIGGNLTVLVEKSESAERASEVKTYILKGLRDYPGEILVEGYSDSLYGGGGVPESSKQIAMGDAFVCDSRRATIGLFMDKIENERESLHFITCSHAVLGSERVTTADPNPIPLGQRSIFLKTEDSLLDIAAIQIHKEMRAHCNPYFPVNNEPPECSILDMDGIKKLKEFEHVYRIGPASQITQGCILSIDFEKVGLKNHNIVIGVPPGCEAKIREKGFAEKGDSGAVVYTKTATGEIQYIGIIMGELLSDELEGNSRLAGVKQAHGPLIVTSLLWEGLNQIEKEFSCKLTLPKPEVSQPEEKNPNVA